MRIAIKSRMNWKKAACCLLLPGLLLCVVACQPGGPGKRVTTVTGLVLDETQKPVDNVLVDMYSAGFKRPGVKLGETYTNEKGEYKLVVDVPKDFGYTTVGIPSSLNEGFTRLYKDYRIYQDGNELGTCCGVGIGSTVSYDFVLLFK